MNKKISLFLLGLASIGVTSCTKLSKPSHELVDFKAGKNPNQIQLILNDNKVLVSSFDKNESHKKFGKIKYDGKENLDIFDENGVEVLCMHSACGKTGAVMMALSNKNSKGFDDEGSFAIIKVAPEQKNIAGFNYGE